MYVKLTTFLDLNKFSNHEEVLNYSFDWFQTHVTKYCEPL